MFNIFKKIIDDSIALSHASSLTGLPCTSIIKVAQIETKIEDQSLSSLIESLDKSIGVQERLELGFYAFHNQDVSEPVVTLQFQKGFSRHNDKINLRLNFTKGRLSYNFLTIGVNHNQDYSSDESVKFSYRDIQCAVELSRWIVAKGINLGKMHGFGIITRTDYKPRIIYA